MAGLLRVHVGGAGGLYAYVEAATGRRVARVQAAVWTVVVGAIVLAAAPLTLLDPDGFYDALAQPSLVALWISQLIVFAVFPRFARRGTRPLPACTLGLTASAFAVYGLYNAIAHVSS